MKRIVSIAACIVFCSFIHANIIYMFDHGYVNGVEHHSKVPTIDVSCDKDLLYIASMGNIARMEIKIMDANDIVIYSNTVSVMPNIYMKLPKNVVAEKRTIEVTFDGNTLKGTFED